MIPIYDPSKYNIGIGIPGTPAYAEIKDWTNFVQSKPRQRFNMRRGIWGETFLGVNGDSSRTFSVTILQSSKDVQNLHNIFLAQLIGIVGAPFSMIDNGKDTTVPQGRQKSFYPVGVILDERQENFGLQGAGWIYQIGVAAGGTVYF